MVRKLKGKLSRLILIIWFAKEMWKTLNLQKNSSKGGWEKIEEYRLLRLLHIEYDELYTACWEQSHGKGSAERVLAEATDVANFAAMIASNAILRGRARKEILSRS